MLKNREKKWCPNTSRRGISRDDMDTVRRPSDRDVNWRPPVQGESSPVQVKGPYTGSILMHVGSGFRRRPEAKPYGNRWVSADFKWK